MVSGVVRVNNQSTLMILDPPDLSPSPDPRCVGACDIHLRDNQHPQHEN